MIKNGKTLEFIRKNESLIILENGVYNKKNMKSFIDKAGGDGRADLILYTGLEYIEDKVASAEILGDLLSYLDNEKDVEHVLDNMLAEVIGGEDEKGLNLIIDFINNHRKSKEERLRILTYGMGQAAGFNSVYCFECMAENIKKNGGEEYLKKTVNKLSYCLLEDSIYNNSQEMIKAISSYLSTPISGEIIMLGMENADYDVCQALMGLEFDLKYTDEMTDEMAARAIELGRGDLLELLIPKIDKNINNNRIYEAIVNNFDKELCGMLIDNNCIDVNERQGNLLERFIWFGSAGGEGLEWLVKRAKKDSIEINTKLMMDMIEVFEFDGDTYQIMLDNLEFDNKAMIYFIETEFDREYLRNAEINAYQTFKSRLEKGILDENVQKTSKTKKSIRAF